MSEIDRESAVPPYRQLYEILKEKIDSGAIPAGRRLPSELTMEAEYGLSRDTIRKAVAVLREEGLVETVPGLGVAVKQPDPPAKPS
jgi:GntR family transcriptional regulator